MLTSRVPGSGEGLYAVRNIEKDEIVAFYNGVSNVIFFHHFQPLLG